jgi:hypothetical protein
MLCIYGRHWWDNPRLIAHIIFNKVIHPLKGVKKKKFYIAYLQYLLIIKGPLFAKTDTVNVRFLKKVQSILLQTFKICTHNFLDLIMSIFKAICISSLESIEKKRFKSHDRKCICLFSHSDLCGTKYCNFCILVTL